MDVDDVHGEMGGTVSVMDEALQEDNAIDYTSSNNEDSDQMPMRRTGRCPEQHKHVFVRREENDKACDVLFVPVLHKAVQQMNLKASIENMQRP